MTTITTTPTLDQPTIETFTYPGETTPSVRVAVQWKPQDGLDRLDAHAWGLGRDSANARRLAQRLVRAIEAGVVLYPSGAYTDATGARGVHCSSRILSRTMNAELRRLGF